MSYLVYRLGKRGGQKRSNDTSLGYYAAGTLGGQRDSYAPMPVSRGLPRFERVRVKGEDGKTRVKRIGYCPNEQTIFLDDYINEDSKPKKLKFKKGVLRVDPDKDPIMYEFLENSNFNEDNPNRDPNAPIKFHRNDKHKSATDALKRKEKINKELSLFWDLPLTKKRAIANYVGVPTAEKDPSVWTWKLFLWAENNVKKFVSAYHSQDLDYADYISRAEHMGILRYNAGEWTHHDVKILTVGRHQNQYEELIKHLINNPKLNLHIRNDVKAKEGRTDLQVDETMTIDFAKLSGEEMLDLAIEKRVVKYNQGHGYHIVAIDKYIGEDGITKSKKGAIELLETDKILFEQVKAQLLK